MANNDDAIELMREVARLKAELGIEKLNRKEEVGRLKDLLSRTVGPAALEDLRTDLSVARQSLYEVAQQREAFLKENKRLKTILRDLCAGHPDTCWCRGCREAFAPKEGT